MAIWCPNRVEWIVAVLGVWDAGAVVVPVNTRFKGTEAAQILGRSRARVLVTTTDFLGVDNVEMLDGVGVELPALETIVAVGGPATGRSMTWASFLARADDRAIAEAGRRAAAVGEDDPSDIVFTSGTTGTPKGVVQTHGRTLRVGTDWVAMTGLSAGDRYLMINPYFHMFGLKAGILASVAAGATMLPQAVFDVDDVLARIGVERVAVLPGPPTLYQSILDHPDRDRYDLSSLRIAVTGAADIPVELIRRIRAELPFEVVLVGYGLTEGGTVSGTAPDDPPEVVATTVGRPREGYAIRIVDGDDRELDTGEPGEILIQGPSVMLGYLDDAAATAAAFTADGWLRTGDQGLIEPNGCLRIVGRSKDMFIVGGFNAYPAEIENLLLGHPDIQQAAVIGVPDERMGEVGMAFVVVRPGSELTGPAVVAWSREHMANYKAPRTVEVVAELPLNATGKVVKDQLRQRAAGVAS